MLKMASGKKSCKIKGDGQEMARLMAKILIATIQVALSQLH